MKRLSNLYFQVVLALVIIIPLYSKGIYHTTFSGVVLYEEDSSKDETYYIGMYGSYLYSLHKFEIDLEHSQTDYKDSTPKYRQTDLTVVDNYYLKDNTRLRFGIHNILINQKDNPNNYDNILFAGILYYQLYTHSLGVDVYRSSYDGFNVVQISPKYGVSFGDLSSKFGKFYIETQLNLIDISSKNSLAKMSDYINVDFKIENFFGALTTEGFFSIGNSAYKVAKDGFSVYNTSTECKYTAGVGASYRFKNGATIKATYSKSRFEESQKGEGEANNYSLSFSKAF